MRLQAEGAELQGRPLPGGKGKRGAPVVDHLDVPDELQGKCGRLVVAQPSAEGRGHTGYLTFAWKSVPVPLA